MAQFFGEEGCELDVPLAQRLVAELDATLLKEFLNKTLAQREVVIKPESVLDDARGKPMAVRPAVRHGPSACRTELARTHEVGPEYARPA